MPFRLLSYCANPGFSRPAAHFYSHNALHRYKFYIFKQTFLYVASSFVFVLGYPFYHFAFKPTLFVLDSKMKGLFLGLFCVSTCIFGGTEEITLKF